MTMMRVYLETTIISYLAALPSRDLVKAARQEIALEWWRSRRDHFDLYVSQTVVAEASEGDSEAVARRLALIAGIPILDVTDGAVELAAYLMERGPFPRNAADDALHVAVAAVHGVDYLLTWNCRHLANAEIVGTVEALLVEKGFQPPFICTPDELLGYNDV